MAKELTAPRLAHISTVTEGYPPRLCVPPPKMSIESFRRDQVAFRNLNRKAKINLAKRIIDTLPAVERKAHMQEFSVNCMLGGKELTAWVENLLHMGTVK